MTLRPCLRPGCPELVAGGYCQRHATSSSLRETDATARGYGHRWSDLARAYRRAHPTCERCRERPAELVHHIDGLGPRGPRGLDPANLEAVCRRCHTAAHRALEVRVGAPARRRVPPPPPRAGHPAPRHPATPSRTQ